MSLPNILKDLTEESNNLIDTFTSNERPDNGIRLPNSYSADGNGLPYSKVPSEQQSYAKRNIITWFVPEFGLVQMYVNPNNIQYSDSKLIQKERTKGGFSLQYWGEDLTKLSIQGTTGTSGIEGIQMLQQIYRAEQLAFDSYALYLNDQQNNTNPANVIVKSLGLGDALSELVGGLVGANSPSNTFQDVPTLADFAFKVEMYYNGMVYRGYFQDFNVTERADNFFFDYNMSFICTQKRGYRRNNFGFQRSPAFGPSDYSTPHSINGVVKGSE